jgi:hypothetical protein
MGVEIVRRKLSLFERGGCVAFQSVNLPARQGNMVHIDHLLVSPSGVFVIAVENHPGTILGSYRDAMWVQSHCGQQHRFHNPLRHSSACCEAIRSILGSKHPVQDVVVFVSGALKGNMPENVVPASRLAAFISSHGKPWLSQGGVQRIASAIQSIAMKDADSEHESRFVLRRQLESRLQWAKGLLAVSGILVGIALWTAVGTYLDHLG